MTARLYYDDQTLQQFEATVLSCDVVEARVHVVLDRSAFYPSSGGQPFDTGRLGEANVLDVFDAEDGAVVHVVDRRIEPGTRVAGRIDWARRFDHMQQHTGQHILSAAFDRGGGVRTESFHMGLSASTIDLAREVTPAECVEAEHEANRAIWDDRPVHVRFAAADEVARLPLRKETARTGRLRLVDVEGFDLSACGGTHVARTGMIGAIAIAATERFRGGTRVTFVCGGRVIVSHRRLRDVVQGATRVLSVPADELVPALERAHGDAKDAARRLRRLQEELGRYRAAEIRLGGETMGPYRVVIRAEPDLDAGALKGLASAVVSEAGTIAACTGAGMPVPVVLACGKDVTVNAAALLKEIVGAIGGRGGGTPTMAQGGIATESSAFLDEVRARLQAMVSAPES